MPRKGRRYCAFYPSDEQYLKLKERVDGSGKSLSKYVLDYLGLGIVGSEDKSGAEVVRKPEEPKNEAKIPAYVGETVVDGVDRGPPRALTTKEKQAWHRKYKRKY